MKRKTTRIIGFSLIILTWIFWGLIFLIPFLHLGVKKSAIIITALLIGTNIFYIGVALVGKELIERYNIWPRIKKLFRKSGKG